MSASVAHERMPITQALADPETFAPMFKGDSWARWFVFLACLFGLPCPADAGGSTEQHLAWYRQHTGREEWPGVAFREGVLVCGRRAGKSRIIALVGVFLAVMRRYDSFLAPGEVATVGIIAADRRQARTIFRYVSGALHAIGMFEEMIESETADTITLTNRVQIEIMTASFRATRSYTYCAVLCDECAYWRDDNSANPDVEIINAIRPALGTIPNSLLLIASSPYRKGGMLYKLYRRYFGTADTRTLVWKAASLEMNPRLDAQIVADAMEEDAEAAAAEYFAEFRADLTDWCPREVIDAVTARGLFEIAPQPGIRYVAFCDPSGGTGSDEMSLAIAHRDGDKAVLDCVRAVKAPFSPDQVTQDFADLMQTYRITSCTGDRYAAAWPTERFQTHGIKYVFSELSKSDIYVNVLPAFNSGRVQLLDLPKMAAQFCGLERRTSRSGKDSVDHAPSGHDDRANAVAGALLLVTGKKRGFVFTAEHLASI